MIVGLTTGGVLLLAVILVSVFVVLPQFAKLADVGSSASAPASSENSSANTEILGEDGHMADFRELPGLVVVDAQKGLPSRPNLGTHATALPELNMVLAFNSAYGGTLNTVVTDSYNLVGIDLATGVVAWTFDYASVWDRGTPKQWGYEKDETQVLLELGSPTTDQSSSTMLIVLDARTGTVKASKFFTGLSAFIIHEDTVVVQDEDGLRAFDTDLVTEKWASSALFPEWSGYYDPYTYDILPGGYLLTNNGYLSLADGSQAPFAKNAGQDGISLKVLDGSPEGYVQIEMPNTKDYSFNYSGFDLANNKTTWQLGGVGSISVPSENKLIAEEGNQIGAYRINGNELESQWRYSCETECWLGFADAERVFIQSFNGTVIILSTASGSVIGEIDGIDFAVGKSMFYTVNDISVAAYDLEQEGLPLLWRSEEFHGRLTTLGDALIVTSTTYVDGNPINGGFVGIVGLDGDDWDQFAV